MADIQIVFPTQFSRTNKREYSNPGSHYMNEYGYHFDDDGKKTLIVTGETDVHSRIQVDKDSCDINIIVARFTNGEADALNRVHGLYFDATDMPTTYAEMRQRINDCEVLFDKLPIEVKQVFDNSADEFWSSYGTDEWSKALNSVINPVADPIAEIKVVEKKGEE